MSDYAPVQPTISSSGVNAKKSSKPKLRREPDSDGVLDRSNSSSSNSPYLTRVKIAAFGFFCLFASYNTAQALATSGTTVDKTLGDICLASLYFLFTSSSIFAPNLVQRLGPKVSMMLGACPYCLIIVSNLWPSYGFSITSYALTGIGASLLWTGAGIYIGRCAIRHAQVTGTSKDAATARFNGLFFSLFQANGVCGLLLASVMLQFGGEKAATYLYMVLTVLAGGGVLILSFVKSVDVEKPPQTDGSDADVSDISHVSLFQTLHLMFTDCKMFLATPIIFYNGFSLGFLFAVYTGDLVLPILGKAFIGYVMAAFYFSNSVSTYVWGYVAQKPQGRASLLVAASLLHGAFYAFFYFWPVASILELSQAYIYAVVFASSVVFALGDAVYESQVPAMLQQWYKYSPVQVDAAMGNLKVWQSFGVFVHLLLNVFQVVTLDKLLLLLGGFLLLQVVAFTVLACRYGVNADDASMLLYDEDGFYEDGNDFEDTDSFYEEDTADYSSEYTENS